MSSTPWREYSTPDGRKYYHNTKSNETVWTKPKACFGFAPFFPMLITTPIFLSSVSSVPCISSLFPSRSWMTLRDCWPLKRLALETAQRRLQPNPQPPLHRTYRPWTVLLQRRRLNCFLPLFLSLPSTPCLHCENCRTVEESPSATASPAAPVTYATPEEAREAFTQLLYDKKVNSQWPWDKVCGDFSAFLANAPQSYNQLTCPTSSGPTSVGHEGHPV